MTDPLIAALQPLLQRVRTDASCIKKADGTQAWTREPITQARLAKHLNGGPARGVAPIKPGESVTLVSILDLDSHKGETPWAAMIEAARAVTQTLELLGMLPVVWRSSGGHGIHIHTHWDEPQDAYSVRVFMTEVLAACGYRNGTKGIQAGEIEIFPKQDSVAPDGFGNQFILPLAGASEPLIDFKPAGRDAAAISWPSSPPVPVVARPERQVTAPASVEFAQLRAALAAIPNEGPQERSYDQWRDIVFGVHQATGGSDEGLALVHEFSARSAKYDPAFLDARVWPYVRDREGGITVRSIMATAREYGWAESVEDDFDVVDLSVPGDGAATAAVPLPPFKRNKVGQIEATVGNVLMALRRDDVCRVRVGYDQFTDELMLAPAGTVQWRRFTDEDYTRLRDGLAKGGFKEIGRELMRDAVALVASEQAFDSAIVWLEGLPEHDGEARCETFLHRYFGAEDTPYTRAVSLYLWTALAGRVLVPGCQADMALALLGPQGSGKTTAVRALVPDVQQFIEINLAHRDDNLARGLRGKLVGELGELRGLAGREAEDIKAWLSRRHEEWVPKYKEFTVRFPRRLVLIGTANVDEFLVDATGNRRWLPVRVGCIDTEAIERDRDQLWTEARGLFGLLGVEWLGAERLAAPIHQEHMVSDVWADAVARWLDEPALDGTFPRERKFLRIGEVLQEALGFHPRDTGEREKKRIGNVLRAMGYERKQVRAEGRVIWAYVLPVLPVCCPSQKGTGNRFFIGDVALVARVTRPF